MGCHSHQSCHSAEGKTIITLVITRGTTRLKYLRALDKIYGRRTMSVLVKAKHWDDSLKACDEHLVPGFQALVTNCWRLPSTAGAAAGAPCYYFQASPNGSHQLCTSFASLLFHLFLGMSLWTVISWLEPWFCLLQIGRNVTDRGGWSCDQLNQFGNGNLGKRRWIA